MTATRRPAPGEDEAVRDEMQAGRELTSDQRAILERLHHGAILWDNCGLYGVPVVECAGGYQRVRQRDFKALVLGGYVAIGDPQPIDCPCPITDLGRAALASAGREGSEG